MKAQSVQTSLALYYVGGSVWGIGLKTGWDIQEDEKITDIDVLINTYDGRFETCVSIFTDKHPISKRVAARLLVNCPIDVRYLREDGEV